MFYDMYIDPSRARVFVYLSSCEKWSPSTSFSSGKRSFLSSEWEKESGEMFFEKSGENALFLELVIDCVVCVCVCLDKKSCETF